MLFFSKSETLDMTTIVEMWVHMDCPGCEGKIKRTLQKLDGVDNVDIDTAMQKVTVTGWASQKKVLKTARKSGRQAELWRYPHNPEYHDFNYVYYNQHYRNPATYFAVAEQPDTNFFYSKPYSSYNEHGYNDHDHGYYQDHPPYSTIIDERTSAAFSDENTQGCSIM